MTKVQKRINALLTVVMVICVLLCLIVCLRVIGGKDNALFGYRSYQIMTGSMEPTIPTGAIVIVKETDPDELAVGDVITFISRDKSIYGYANTHRIIAIETDETGHRCYVTRGDANTAEDNDRVYPSEIKGKVVFHMGGTATVFLEFLHTKLGFVLVVLLPLMLLIWIFTKDFKKQVKTYIRGKDEDTDINGEKSIEELRAELAALNAATERETVPEKSIEELKAELAALNEMAEQKLTQ